MKWILSPLVCSSAVLAASGKIDRSIFEHLISDREFQLLDHTQIRDTLFLWKENYPDLIQVSSSQDTYGLERAGGTQDCSHEEDVEGCSNYFFVIQDFIRHPEESASSRELPEIFWSGAMHGSDHLGPTVVMETASLLLQAANCESLPNKNSKLPWDEELAAAHDCRIKLYAQGVSDTRRKWLARLVSTRRLVVVPTPNALGFSRGENFEGSIDPDLDFPYGYNNETQVLCMQSVAARTINEIFRDHMFQISLSFHSGADVIGFPWGSASWDQDMKSPDIRAQFELASAEEVAMGIDYKIEIDQLSKIDQTRRLGILEDWAYASSWDQERVAQCETTAHGGYEMSKTAYNDSTNRAVSLMVSSEADKDQLGGPNDYFREIFTKNDPTTPVARSVRSALASVDIVQPYVAVTAVGNARLSHDVIPLPDITMQQCKTSKAVVVSHRRKNLKVEWTAGGGFDFSQVHFWHAKWDDFDSNEIDCLSQPQFDISEDTRFKEGALINDPDVDVGYGNGMFASSGPLPPAWHSFSGVGGALGPVFRGIFDLDAYELGDEILVMASVRADQSWKAPPIQYSFSPKVAPQTHLINARTNPSWSHEHSGKTINGQLDWYSIPITVVLEDFDPSFGEVELYDRYERKTVDIDSMGTETGGKRWALLVLGTLLAISFFLGLHYKRTRQHIPRVVQHEAAAVQNTRIPPPAVPASPAVAPVLRKTMLTTAFDHVEDLQAFSHAPTQDGTLTRIDFAEDDDSLIIFSDGLDDYSSDDENFGTAGMMA